MLQMNDTYQSVYVNFNWQLQFKSVVKVKLLCNIFTDQ